MKYFMLPVRWFSIFILISFLISCSRLPVIKPVDQTVLPDIIKRCHQPFVDTPYRFIHAIEVTLPGGGSGTVVGVTVIDPASEMIHSVILTIEGFVLFDAQYGKEMRVNRAVPPFNAKDFAEHLMEDVRLILVTPQGRLSRAGVLEDGSTICRYHRDSKKIVDVIIHQDNSWEIGLYSNSYETIRRVNASSIKNSIPTLVKLTAFDAWDYSLLLSLIRAEPVSTEAIQLHPRESLDGE
ncbi:MAG TPA: hypothetical protein VEF33_14530 [Syntrophales bacterium]|nr:hypothetical protein [Syntrophales bacterium]